MFNGLELMFAVCKHVFTILEHVFTNCEHKIFLGRKTNTSRGKKEAAPTEK